ncbi:MAG TPA: DUF3551 domain-containing protein [Candidatus Binataceae bacterium]|nr:DUF3551 domain-containing protein [Candidatus Binataceae bacterium]
MSTLLFTMGLLATFGIGARAEVTYPWCAKDYATNCGFSTFEQCRAAAVGTEQCIKNPSYVSPGPAAGGRTTNGSPRKKAPKQ